MHTRLKHFGFSLLATFAAFAGLASAQVYTSSGAITINDSGPANPYPSVINVTNGPTSIARLSVRINGLTHTFSPDIDVMLVAPGGQSVILMSDAGNRIDLTGVNLTFADGFPQLAIAQIASGTYACTNLQGSEQFAPPAPIASNAQTSLASLMGTNANGAWSLFVLDDANLDSGSIQSWSLEFDAAATVAQGPIDTVFTYQGRLEDNGAPVNGPIDVRYQFWTDTISAAQGSTIGPPLVATGVQAVNGLFSLDVPLVDAAKRANALYLEVAVRVPSGSGDFVPLSPRQRIAPTPQSSYALAASSLLASDGSPLDVVVTDAAGLARFANGLLIDSGLPDSAVGIAFGPFSAQIGGSVEGTDPVGIFRYNPADDVSFLRFCAGDLPSAQDGFQFGIRNAAGIFTPQIVFLSNGTALKPGGGSWSVLSDPRAKHDITPLTNTLDRLLNLRGYSYEYNADMVEQGIALPGRQIGLMADEVERVFPDWISRDEKGTRFVTERSTTALMVEALRDLRTEKDRELAAKQAEIENLKARLDRLEAALIAK